MIETLFTIKVNGPGAVSVNFSDDAVEVGAAEFVIKGSQDLLEGRGGDVAVTFTIVQSIDESKQEKSNINMGILKCTPAKSS